MSEIILGFQVSTLTIESLTAEVSQRILRKKKSAYLACINPHSYAVSLNDEVFSRALHSAEWLVPDGAGILLASRLLGGRIRKRVTGSDIFSQLLRLMDSQGGGRVFLLGSTDSNLSKLKEKLINDFPLMDVVGVYSPPFAAEYSSEENAKIIQMINSSAADILWVGLSAPKQEKWILQNLDQLDVPFVAAIGAVFDFYTGNVKRSHVIFQRLGLEWLPRLIQQPKRLYKRMFVSAPIFLFHVFCESVRRVVSRKA